MVVYKNLDCDVNFVDPFSMEVILQKLLHLEIKALTIVTKKKMGSGRAGCGKKKVAFDIKIW